MSSRSRFPLFPWRSRSTIRRDVDAELEFHLEMRINELVAQGILREDATQRAREEFGDIDFTRAYCRALDERTDRSERFSDRLIDVRHDAAYALRTLRRSFGFTIVSVLTLALAIGANTAIFTVARAVLLKPLPYGHSDAIIAIDESATNAPDVPVSLSPPNFVDYKAQQHAFSDIAAYYSTSPTTWQIENGDPTTLRTVAVAPNLFPLLEVAPQHGRAFAPGADAPGHAPEVVVSYGFWQRSLGGDIAAVGRRLILNGRPTTVIGVMPRGFTIWGSEELWVPLDLSDDLARSGITRRQHWVRAAGRLKPGISIDAARADLEVVARRLALDYPDANAGRSAIVRPLHDVVAGDLRSAVLLLQGAAVLVLLIACANLANLTLSRTLGRRREMALRAALGAGRGRLVRQLLTESVLLAVIGGTFGVALSVVATRTLLALNPETLPPFFDAGIDSRVVLFSAGLSVVTGVLFGVAPAFGVVRNDLHDSLKEGGGGSSVGRGAERLRRTLVVAQVGLAVMLLVGAGLLIRSFTELTRVRAGFDSDHVLTAQLRASGERYDSSAAVNRFFDSVLGDIARAPGIVAVGAASHVPTRGRVSSSLRIEGEPTDEKALPDLGYVGVRGEYFKAMRIPLITGRLYDAGDLPNGDKRVIINQTAAVRFFPKGDAVGRRIRIGPNPNAAWMTIIGVVGDVRDEGLDVPAKPTLFANHRQEAWEHSLAVVIRTSGDPRGAIPILKRALRSADPALAAREVETLDEVVGSSLAPRRFALGLASSFALLALILAAVGIYGVLAYVVTSRTREFGVRLALGATARNVLGLVLRQGFGWSLLGLALGIVGAIAGGRLLSGMLFGITPLDASTYGAVVVGLLVVVAVACIVPAARATRVDPLTSMRSE